MLILHNTQIVKNKLSVETLTLHCLRRMVRGNVIHIIDLTSKLGANHNTYPAWIARRKGIPVGVKIITSRK